MLTLKTVLPNFTKTLVLLIAVLFSINTFAADEEATMEKAEDITKEMSEATSDTLGAAVEQVEETAEEALEEVSGEIPDIKDMGSE